MFCENCGNELEEGELFCPQCGSKVSVEETLTPADTAEPAVSREIKKKSPVPVVAGIAAAVLITALIVILYITCFSSPAKEKRQIREYLKHAEIYLDELEYEQAVAAYQAILEIDPKNEEAIEALADTYRDWAASVKDSDPQAARKICEEAESYFVQLDEKAGENVSGRAVRVIGKEKGTISSADEAEEERTPQEGYGILLPELQGYLPCRRSDTRQSRECRY